MTTSIANSAQPVQETWTYVGVRLGAPPNRKLYHTFIDVTGEEKWYAKNPGVRRIGYYTIPVVREGEKVSVILHRCRWVGEYPDSEQVDHWTAVSEADRVIAESQRADRAAKNRLKDMTLEDLRLQMRKMTTPRRRALLASVLDILCSGGYDFS